MVCHGVPKMRTVPIPTLPALEVLWVYPHLCLTLPTSVTMVMTDVFHKNGIMVSRKLATIMRIFVDIGHIKTEGSYIGPKESDQ